MIQRPVAGRTRVRLALFLVLSLLLAASTAPRAVSPDVVISQVYGGGGNSGAVLQNDFVELFNRGTTPVSLAGRSIQYASATGTGNFAANPVIALSGTLAPGQDHLVQLARRRRNGVALPSPDATGTAQLAAAAGKVALVSSTVGPGLQWRLDALQRWQLGQILDLRRLGTAPTSSRPVAGRARATRLPSFEAMAAVAIPTTTG